MTQRELPLEVESEHTIVVRRQLKWARDYVKKLRVVRASPDAIDELRDLATELCEFVHDTFVE